MGAPLVPFDPTNDTGFQVRVPIHQAISDCAIPDRPGQLNPHAQPELAQTQMAGGRRTYRTKRTKQRRQRTQSRHRGGKFQSEFTPVNQPGSDYKVGLPITQGFPNCGNATVPSWLMSQANPSLAQTPMPGYKQTGGGNGFSVQPVNVGGESPNVAAVYQSIACDARAGSPNVLNPSEFLHDPRAPADLFSMTPNQTGGSYASGNDYEPECYRATGSMMPVYEAPNAGFEFKPSLDNGGTLPDGVTAYMDVIPRSARLGGARKTLRRVSKVRKSKRLPRK